MTEQEWLECVEPEKMLELLQGKVSDRKLRLFAVACCRRIWHLMTDERSRNAVEVAESYADGLMNEAALASAKSQTPEGATSSGLILYADWACANCASNPPPSDSTFGRHQQAFRIGGAYVAAVRAAYFCTNATAFLHRAKSSQRRARYEEEVAQSDLLLDIFGPLFVRSITVNSTWRTSTVVSLATAIYEEGAFDRLPILADALEDAGCDNTDILNHCRQPGEHVRGCWVVDLLLAKQ